MLAGFLFRADGTLQVSAPSAEGRCRALPRLSFRRKYAPRDAHPGEPTNHLEFDSNQAIKTASATFDGALLVVSHDEAFLGAIGLKRRIVRPS